MESIAGASLPLVRAIRRELRAAADPARAAPMRAYVKSKMPVLGVQVGEMRAACRRVFSAYALPTAEAWQATVLQLWRPARYREERYAAIELTGWRDYRTFQRMKALPMYEEMIVSGAWWDLVDGIATHRLADLLRAYPRGMNTKMRIWSRSRDMWKRRSSIICQVSFKRETDEELLFGCIHPSMEEREFFLRKAIGWALREYGKVAPGAVAGFVRRNETQLSGLSKREALKYVGPV